MPTEWNRAIQKLNTDRKNEKDSNSALNDGLGCGPSERVAHRFLFVLEDGNICTCATASDDDKLMVDAGLMTIVDMVIGKEYYDGAWIDIEICEAT